MKKKKRFYDNKDRNSQWTEPTAGRKIDFADKYLPGSSASDKYDNLRRREDNRKKAKAKKRSEAKKAGCFLLCILMVCVGYTLMDVRMDRSARPAERLSLQATAQTADLSNMKINISSRHVDSVSFDSAVMLSSVIDDAVENGYTSVTFDAKREDGTVGYASALASVDTFGAISSPGSHPKASVEELLANDILPVARIYCYKDNIAATQSPEAAIMNGGDLYTDDNGFKYLNPDSEITYNYIKDIIKELNSYGITVFVLSGCDLPDELGDKYSDGFDALAAKLNNDFSGGVKFLEQVDVKINGKDKETGKTTNSAIKADIEKFDKIKDNQIYVISTKIDEKKVAAQLEKKDITSYIIE